MGIAMKQVQLYLLETEKDPWKLISQLDESVVAIIKGTLGFQFWALGKAIKNLMRILFK